MREGAESDVVRVRAGDGWWLGAERRRPQDTARGVVLALHAMMVDRRSLDRPRGEGLASHLAGRGWEVWLPDARGRGHSLGPGPSGGWSYDDLVHGDLPAWGHRARAAAGRRPVVVVGHSLGGHTAAAALGTGALAADALVTVGANVWRPALEPEPWVRGGKAVSLAAFQAVSHLWGRFPSRRLRVGPVDEATRYVDDLARTWWRDRWAPRDAGGLDYTAGLQAVDVPVLAVLGSGDRWLGRAPAAAAWASPMGAEVWVAGRGEAGLTGDPGHMDLVTDPASRPLWDRIADWLDTATERR